MLVISLGAVGVATWVGVTFAHRSPINWIGLSSVALGFLFFATRETLPADLRGSFERFHPVRRFLAWRRYCASALKFDEDRLLPRKPPAPAAAPAAEAEPAAESKPEPESEPAPETKIHAQA
jgi:hypothetical protein